MNKLYVFMWYDSNSYNGWNYEYLITDNPINHSIKIGHGCCFKEFKQDGFEIEITKPNKNNGNWDNFRPGDMK